MLRGVGPRVPVEPSVTPRLRASCCAVRRPCPLLLGRAPLRWRAAAGRPCVVPLPHPFARPWCCAGCIACIAGRCCAAARCSPSSSGPAGMTLTAGTGHGRRHPARTSRRLPRKARGPHLCVFLVVGGEFPGAARWRCGRDVRRRCAGRRSAAPTRQGLDPPVCPGMPALIAWCPFVYSVSGSQAVWKLTVPPSAPVPMPAARTRNSRAATKYQGDTWAATCGLRGSWMRWMPRSCRLMR